MNNSELDQLAHNIFYLDVNEDILLHFSARKFNPIQSVPSIEAPDIFQNTIWERYYRFGFKIQSEVYDQILSPMAELFLFIESFATSLLKENE